MATRAPFDLAIIGGGINGCGIARDAAGRGARVVLFEQGDLASGTSSASTKLIHGGLRYLEHHAFGLVRDALLERERLLRIAPHLIGPLRFVLPHSPGLRPRWLLRTGLWLYDHLGGRSSMPATTAIDFGEHPAGAALRPGLSRGWEYSDGWVDDARLVILNARDAADRGATVRTRARVVGAQRVPEGWRLDIAHADGSSSTCEARILVNAAGPGVLDIVALAAARPAHRVRRIRGSHIVVPRLFDHDFAYILQRRDRRIFFAIPYERDFTLIGTTECDHVGSLEGVTATRAEIDYLCDGANLFFQRAISAADVVWSFAGVRALVDGGEGRPDAASRGYRIDVGTAGGHAPLLSVYGGKITTYRLLAEEAVDRLAPYLAAIARPRWTGSQPLPGGDLGGGRDAFVASLAARYRFLDEEDARRIGAAYGTLAATWLGEAKTRGELGRDFGAGLSAAEVNYCMAREWARTAGDMLWRRTKLGLKLDASARAELDAYMTERVARMPDEGEGA